MRENVKGYDNNESETGFDLSELLIGGICANNRLFVLRQQWLQKGPNEEDRPPNQLFVLERRTALSEHGCGKNVKLSEHA